MKKPVHILTTLIVLICLSIQVQAQTITTIVGNGISGYLGDGGPATAAEMNAPHGAAKYYEGNLYISDWNNNRIRKVEPFTGTISTIAGNGTGTFSGDGGAATAATINSPVGITFDPAGNIIFADQGNSCVREINITTGIITTIAGTGTAGYSGDHGAATAAHLYYPNYVAYNSLGDLFITDGGNYTIRKVDHATGIITTVAGTTSSTFSGDGIAATAAGVYPYGICFDAYDNLYFADNHDRVRKINTSGIITTFAGNGIPGYAGDGGSATAAKLSIPNDVAIDQHGNILIADFGNNCVRQVNSSGIISTIVGTGAGAFGGDGGPATAAQLQYVASIDLDCSGNLYIGDMGNHRVREVNYFLNHLPNFVNGPSQKITLCQCSGATSLNSLLQISDIDTGQNEWWIAYAGPIHGTLGGFPAVGVSTGGTISPSGLTYTPPCTTYYAKDTFQIGIADCAGGTNIINVYVTVNPTPAAITGSSTVCLGTTTTFTDSISGGVWTSSNTSIATVGSGTGVVTGVDTGAATITYTLGTGCTVTKTVTVIASPPAISGTAHVCLGSTTTLSDGTTGGTWVSGSPGIASVGSGTGIVTGAAVGTATITYGFPGVACRATIIVTVNPLPLAITGTLNVCVGSTVTLSDGTGGGIWTSSNTLVATIGSGSGVVSGVSAGTATISYTLGTGCMMTTIVTVNPIPAGITGITNVCVGATTTLSDATAGGAWASGSPGIAAAGSSTGIVMGVTAGTATIFYGLPTGCRSATTVTVNPLPAAITGNSPVCAGATVTLGDPNPGGTWTSGSTGIAIIGSSSGVVTGVTTGTAPITYTLGTGCAITTVVTVSISPATITGTMNVCVGSTTTLSDATSGGTWSSSSSSATVGSSSGVVAGITAGTATITYTIPDGCFTVTTVTVTSPAAITGTMTVCAGSTTTLSDATGGGTWSSSTTTVATIGSSSGIVTGVAAGTVTITYNTGCITTATVTVNVSPSVITGTANVCVGLTTTLSDATSGGTWTSSNTAIAAVGSASGTVTGVTAGTVTITYAISDGCYSTAIVTVNPLPAAITGPANVCLGFTINLSDATISGTWSSSSANATIGSSSGVVTGITTGPATITYTLSTGCITTYTITVDTLPAPITGITGICTDSTTHLYDVTGTGTWSSSNTAIATVGSSGIVTTVSLGTAIITYTTAAGCYVTTTVSPLSISGLHNMCAWVDTLTAISVPGGSFSSTLVTVTNLGGGLGKVRAYGPGSATVTYTLPNGCFVTGTLTVNPLPKLITGTGWICSGSTITLSDSVTGGSWSSDSTSIATVGSTTGIVTGVSTGIAVITYTLPTGCWADTSVVVNPLPTAIGGNSFLCIGSTINLSDGYPGGTWTSSNTAIATVGSTTGIVTGHAYGIDTIIYTLCTHSVTTVVTVSPLPPIKGANTLCVGAATTLTDMASGGRWYSSSTAIATVGSTSGIVTAVAAGSVTISYSLATACTLTFAMQVTNDTGSCTPCSVFGAYTSLGTSGHITGNVGPGNYYIGNNVTVSNIDTFTNAIILIAPYDTVFIDTNAMLTLDSTHMFSLCTEWQGIALKPGRTHSGRLFVTSHSLIEDAFCAVYIPNAVAPPSGGLIFKSEASIFNRNAIGIFIQHYNPATPIYPFLVHNTVITSRDLQTTNPNFPYQWPPTIGVGGLKNYWSPGDTFSTPYNIDNPAPGLGYSYPAVYCYGGGLPTNGIRLDSVGSNNVAGHSGVPIPGRYYETVVGDTTTTVNNQNQNLFDALQFGIYSVNSNLTCINNVFADLFANNRFSMHPTSMGGDGIYAAETDDYANQNRLRVYTPPGAKYGNKFYNFTLGAECSNMFQVIGQHCYMMNKDFGTLFEAPAGAGGFYIKTAKYDTIDISYDTITNVTTGIAVWMAFDPTIRIAFTGGPLITIPSQFMGTCNLNYNLLQVHPDWTASLSGGQHMNLGISYQNPYTYIPAMDVSTVANSLTIAVNTIHDSYNGIYVNNYAAPRGFNTYTFSNKIWERQNATGTPQRLQYGINHSNSYNSHIYYDSIVTGTVASVTGRGTDSMRAFYSAHNSGMDMGCNQELNLGRGYEFFLPHGATNWHDNHMTSNYKGFVLNGATIGSQVNGGTTLASRSINDKWLGTWGSGDTQTYVISASAYSSPIYVSIGSTTYPTINGGRPFFLIYQPGNIDTAATIAPDCFLHWSAPYDTMSFYNLIAQQHVSYLYNVVPSTWMAQYSLWKAAMLDSTIADSSEVVAEFMHLADSVSRFKYITSIETALSAGDLSTASSLLSMSIDPMTNTAYDPVSQVWLADDTTADYIVQAYQQFYGLYINYVTAAMSGADSVNILVLAQLCPERYGGVVFQARALYSDIYNDLSVFNDDSCLDVDTSYIAARHTNPNHPAITTNTGVQTYLLYPNPNDGSFMLKQSVADNEPVDAVVTDAVGRVIYRGTELFTNGKSRMGLGNYAPGIYLLELKDAQNRTFRFKFVISK